MLAAITPVILTFNEGPNIGRTLGRLAWAKDIVVVDSGSTDETLRLLAGERRVRLFQHPFVSHHDQWRFATQETGIETPWILRLDADYQVPDALVTELAKLDPEAPVDAYRVGFDYAVFGQRLVASLYPANTILLRRGRFSIRDDGHTEAWQVDGPVGALQARVVHDDWKPATAWLSAQDRYMAREADKVVTHRRGLRDWLRSRPPLMPLAVFAYCLFGKGLLFSGRAGLHYTLQRTVAEAILSIMLLERRLRPDGPARAPQPE